MPTRIGLLLALLAVVVLSAASQRSDPMLFGFTREHDERQRDVERRFVTLPSANRIRDAHRFLADKPHVAGSARDRQLAEWTRDQFRDYGLEQVEITTHEVLLPWPQEISVEMSACPEPCRGAPRHWKASMREDPVREDPYTQASVAELGLPYHAYSASG